jgi:hypothetical protein
MALPSYVTITGPFPGINLMELEAVYALPSSADH